MGPRTVYVDIPEQSVESGIIRLTVTEGRLDQVRVSGTRYFMNRHILAALPSLEPGAVPHFPDLQRQLNALNQASPDLGVAPVLKPGPQPGTVDVDLKVKDTLPLHASLEVNDRYTADTTHTRVSLDCPTTICSSATRRCRCSTRPPPKMRGTRASSPVPT